VLRELYFRVIVLSLSLVISLMFVYCCLADLKSILVVGPKVKHSIEDPSK
jgi:hypothetical protein